MAGALFPGGARPLALALPPGLLGFLPPPLPPLGNALPAPLGWAHLPPSLASLLGAWGPRPTWLGGAPVPQPSPRIAAAVAPAVGPRVTQPAPSRCPFASFASSSPSSPHAPHPTPRHPGSPRRPLQGLRALQLRGPLRLSRAPWLAQPFGSPRAPWDLRSP